MSTTTAPSRPPPKQARALARRQLIVETAATLIAEVGADRMKMSEIAARAGVPIGSVYQFFPDKADIVRHLAIDLMAQISATLQASFGAIETCADALSCVENQIEAYYQLFLSRPALRDIWASTQGDKILIDLDIADSRANGAALSAALVRLAPAARKEGLGTACFLNAHLTGAAVRLAITLDPEEGRALMDQHKAQAIAALQAAL